VLAVLLPVVVLASGLAAGVMMWTQLGGWPLMSSLSPERYVYTHAFFSTRFDPFMPACMLITAIGAVVLAAWVSAAVTKALFLLVAVLTVGSIAISIVKNVPVNRWIRTLDPENLPADFPAIRRRWGDWNRVRAALAVASFGATCVALATLL
jgi:uncharacterized membrane protein